MGVESFCFHKLKQEAVTFIGKSPMLVFCSTSCARRIQFPDVHGQSCVDPRAENAAVPREDHPPRKRSPMADSSDQGVLALRPVATPGEDVPADCSENALLPSTGARQPDIRLLAVVGRARSPSE